MNYLQILTCIISGVVIFICLVRLLKPTRLPGPRAGNAAVLDYLIGKDNEK